MWDNDPLAIYPRPRVVCLCGSTRFKEQFLQATYQETMAGKVVLSVGFFAHVDKHFNPKLTLEEKEALDNLHFRKIDMSDEVLIISVGGYIGESTTREAIYAHRKGKLIRFWEPINPEKLGWLFQWGPS